MEVEFVLGSAGTRRVFDAIECAERASRQARDHMCSSALLWASEPDRGPAAPLGRRHILWSTDPRPLNPTVVQRPRWAGDTSAGPLTQRPQIAKGARRVGKQESGSDRSQRPGDNRGGDGQLVFTEAPTITIFVLAGRAKLCADALCSDDPLSV
jgi:hypothetical protein